MLNRKSTDVITRAVRRWVEFRFDRFCTASLPGWFSQAIFKKSRPQASYEDSAAARDRRHHAESVGQDCALRKLLTAGLCVAKLPTTWGNCQRRKCKCLHPR